MDSESARIDFAAIGHQDSWDKISMFVNSMRNSELRPLTIEQIKDTYAFIPPRKIFDVFVGSTKNKSKSKGIYIETFISPDELKVKHFKKCLSKIREASKIAARYDSGIAALGGFTSIMLEGELDLLDSGVTYTTGNTLTAAFIVKSVEKACALRNVTLQNSSLMVVGSTGDIGSAITQYFSERCNRLFLFARNEKKLKEQLLSLKQKKAATSIVKWPVEEVSQVNIIISVASSTDVFRGIRPEVPQIICDAGYPKNLENFHWHEESLYYYGGMGIATGGVEFSNEKYSSFYDFPMKNIVHGCLLEAIVLGFDKRHEAFSHGKGNITEDKMKEIINIAQRHGVDVAPFFNHQGLCRTKEKT